MGVVNVTDTSVLHIVTEYCSRIGYSRPLYDPTAGTLTIAGVSNAQVQAVIDKCTAGTDAVIADYVTAKAADASKMTGVLIDGVMCSATGQDQAGLTAVYAAINAGLIASTVFRFENGNTLTINAANVAAVAAAWSTFRNSFYI